VLLEPIGTVKSPIEEQVDEGWGEVVSEIWLNAELEPGLDGLAEFSHAVIIFLMHQSSFDVERDLKRRPRGRVDMPQTGIFAQRAKHRPNPIGLTAVKILGVAGPVLRVKGLDAIDGTPILDIKPYVPAFDRVENAAVPGWIEQILADYF
jgi:tRNA-Thr(GGU) m(6)t(6)A37 methyltransferase TsaA